MNKKNKVLLLLFVLIINGIILMSSNLYNEYEKSENYKEIDGLGDFPFIELKTSEYSSRRQGYGENINITLHQSFLNTTIISFKDLNKDNTFSEPCPTISNFNSSFINILIEDIRANNISLIVQNNVDNGEIDCNTPRLTSFSVNSNCYITNASINIKRTTSPTGNIYLYRSSWNSSLGRNEPTGTPTTVGMISPTSNGWLDIDLVDTFLNNSITDNNTWFFGVVRTSAGGTIQWRYTDDTITNNNSYAYYSNGGWTYEARDYLLEIGLAPINATPFPQDIGLKINNTPVINFGMASGNWISTEELQSSSGFLNFTLTSDWDSLSLNITKVQINYTKTDLQASSSFNTFKGDSEITWNVSRSNGLNFFDRRINNYKTINFTIPIKWNNINVFNNSLNKTNDILIRNLNNRYKDVQIFNAGNGSFWFLIAKSANLLKSIDVYENLNPTDTVNYSSIVHFNATFFTKIAQNDGVINLSVYSPVAINDFINFTMLISSFGPASEISLGEWDVSNNITQHGLFRVQIFWNNDTDAGFLEKNITIFGDTDITLIKPIQYESFNSDQIFNITVYFHDNGVNKSVDGTLWYNINGEIWQYTTKNNGTSGYYNITIDCSKLFPYGPQIVSISLNQTFYHNSSLDYNFSVIGLSELKLISPVQKSFFTPDQIFNITVYYNDTTNDQPINGTMWYSINGGMWQSISNNNGTTGYYNITIDCSTFSPYGPQSVSISLNQTYYQNQTLIYQFSIGGFSELILIKPSQNATFYANQTFDVIVYYNDTTNDQPINGTMWYSINGGPWQSTSNNNGTAGYYNITIDCSTFSPYGPQSLTISLNQTYYQNKTLDYQFSVIGFSELLLIKPSQNTLFNSDQIFNITVYYNDTLNNQPINGTMWYSINKGPWHSTTNNNGTTGYYNITIDCSTFSPYGPQSILISGNHTYYQNQTLDFNFIIYGISGLKLITPSQNQLFNTDQSCHIVVYFNDTIKNQPINGTMWYSINGGIWQSTTNNNGTAGYYNITLDCSTFSPYGPQSVLISLNQTYYNNNTLNYAFRVLGLTDLSITNLNQFINSISDEYFNITVYFYDFNNGIGIVGANISYNINGTVYNYIYEIGNGYYNITINNWQVCNDIGFGLIDITIDANQPLYYNQTLVFHYYLYNATSQLIDLDTLHVVRSQNATFTVFYLGKDLSPIQGAQLQIMSINPDFSYTWSDNGDGSYSLELETINVLGLGSNPYIIIFNLSYSFNQTQIYSVNLYIWNRTSFLVNGLTQLNYSYYHNMEPWLIYYGEDVTFNISYFDIDYKNKLILGGWGNFTLFNSTKSWNSVLLYTDLNGYYQFTLDTNKLFTGIYYVKVQLNSTYFNSTIGVFQFEIIPCNVSYNIIALNQYGGTINLNSTIYEAYFGDNISIYLNFVNYFSNDPIIGGFGILSFNFQNYYYFDIDRDGIYLWEINTSQLIIGRYSFTINFINKNYQNFSFEIVFDINKFNININIIEQPVEVAPGDSFNISFNITNNFIGNPINNLNISILVDFGVYSWSSYNITSFNGKIIFKINVPLNATRLNITILFLGDNAFNANEVSFSIDLNIENNGNGSLTNHSIFIVLLISLIIGTIIGTGLFVIYKKKRISSPKSIAGEDLKTLSPIEAEEEFKDSIQEELIIRKSIETTKEIDKILKKGVLVKNKFMILNLDNLKDKIESKMQPSIDKKDVISELVESKVALEQIDDVFLIDQIELETLKGSIRKLNKEGLDLLKKGEIKDSLEKFKKIRELLREYFE
ncbi:MAG: hypothetical protein JSV62_10785 [Promethearchaeota archaeon]|nr:MAG: hypothetical protein JSV62_10785 [Candidatus Lokiarchaeota archaeon]